jgi:hypothetical protein
VNTTHILRPLTLCAAALATSLSLSAVAAGFDQVCETTSHFVVITENPKTGLLDYTSWRLSDGWKTSRSPDLALTNGQPAGGGSSYGISFANGDFHYSIHVRDVMEDSPVRWLMVNSGPKILLAEMCL